MAPRSFARPVILLATLAAGCRAPFSPSDVAGTYALKRIANDPLPTMLFTSGLDVAADTLRLNADGYGTRVFVLNIDPRYAGHDSGRREGDFQFIIVKGHIELTFPCPRNETCIPIRMKLRPWPDGLLADSASGQRIPLIYARVASEF